MKRKLIIGAAVASMLLATPVSFAADEDIVVFGDEFDQSPRRRAMPIEEPAVEEPTVEEPTVEEPTVEQPTVEEPTIEQPFVDQPPTSEQPPVETQPLNDLPPEPPPPPIEEPQPPIEQPAIEQPPIEQTPVAQTPVVEESTNEVEDDIDIGDTLRFNRLTGSNPTSPTVQPIEQPIDKPIDKPVDTSELVDERTQQPEIEVEPFKDLTPSETITFEPKVDTPEPAVDQPYRRIDTLPSIKEQTSTQPSEPPKKKKGKKIKPRFVKVAADDTFDYYLDKASVQWQNMPYSTSEYLADVWVRMIDRSGGTGDLPQDVQDYVAGGYDEVAAAEANGYIYNETDAQILRTKKYFLEHYYLRPKTRQIQFLCELEVIGRPQNTISEREYSYKNWENLIPGSVETAIYYGVLDVIGTGKASSRGHMTFTDMVEEYARISIR